MTSGTLDNFKRAIEKAQAQLDNRPPQPIDRWAEYLVDGRRVSGEELIESTKRRVATISIEHYDAAIGGPGRRSRAVIAAENRELRKALDYANSYLERVRVAIDGFRKDDC